MQPVETKVSEVESFIHRLPLDIWGTTASPKALRQLLAVCTGTCSDRVLLSVLYRQPFDSELVMLFYEKGAPPIHMETSLLVKAMLSNPNLLPDKVWAKQYNNALINHTFEEFRGRLCRRFSPVRICTHPNFLSYIKDIAPVFCQVQVLYLLGNNKTGRMARLNLAKSYPKSPIVPGKLYSSATKFSNVTVYGTRIVKDSLIDEELFQKALDSKEWSFPFGPFTLVMVLFDILEYGNQEKEFIAQIEAWHQTIPAIVEIHRN